MPIQGSHAESLTWLENYGCTASKTVLIRRYLRRAGISVIVHLQYCKLSEVSGRWAFAA
jgi:hypothetical protein